MSYVYDVIFSGDLAEGERKRSERRESARAKEKEREGEHNVMDGWMDGSL